MDLWNEWFKHKIQNHNNQNTPILQIVLTGGSKLKVFCFYHLVWNGMFRNSSSNSATA